MMPRLMLQPLLSEKRSLTYAVILQVWFIVAIYAVCHDQYIVRIAPEHFTIYHDPLLGIEDPTTLAAVYAFGASFSPGLLLGFCCAAAARGGEWPKVRVRRILLGVFVVVLATEVVAASSGYIVYKSGRGIYPASWYPTSTLPMLITQTIQVTCYLAAAMFSSVFLAGLLVYRHRKRGE
ncbi:hypothetical protein JO972_14685 [Verrucomicrobiaceae bacterium 5K15]|uniref:Uncharacterized protein n=1 Tax=Oceaniferula flava TaxID=2800421 RepID=A0AAE2VA32_9BACT|nr:hypothetical protein [Oceaniferula flavus]MBK1856213.1 hypothetical protein [Oceaniferula flavus]MBM1137520.1 hypothetical protein [Oceaniferula flavus]